MGLTKKDEPDSILRAVDGCHLDWSDFRKNVLLSFNIVVQDEVEPESLDPIFVTILKQHLDNPDRFDKQRGLWRSQVAAGRGFANHEIFPPNVLPPLPSDRPTLRRCTAPKMSRETLPPRQINGLRTLYELPTIKPAHISGFSSEHIYRWEMLSSGLSMPGTVVNFDTGEVKPLKSVCLPFLTFEKINGVEDRDIEAAVNNCAIAGAQSLRGLSLLMAKAWGSNASSTLAPLSFSCALNNKIAIINYHTITSDGKYAMMAVCKFDLEDNENFNLFQVWIESIDRWAISYILPRIHDATRRLSATATETPPISPVPSLTLSIDTKIDSGCNLLTVLRKHWPATRWHLEGAGDTPINSSIAQCGTPLFARRMRSVTLSPKTPRTPSAFGPLRRGKSDAPFSPLRLDSSNWQKQQDAFSPGLSTGGMMDSPCRPPSLSPCTPPPDMPCSSRSPVLVIRRRLDVAMDEVQELRKRLDDMHVDLITKQVELDDRTQEFGKQLSALLSIQKAQEERNRASEAKWASRTDPAAWVHWVQEGLGQAMEKCQPSTRLPQPAFQMVVSALLVILLSALLSFNIHAVLVNLLLVADWVDLLPHEVWTKSWRVDGVRLEDIGFVQCTTTDPCGLQLEP